MAATVATTGQDIKMQSQLHPSLSSTDTIDPPPSCHANSEITDTTSPFSTAMTSASTTYNLYYTTSRLNATLHAGKADTPASYYLESKCSLIHPRLLLRSGGSKGGPVVAFVKFRNTSRHMTIGLGNCEDKDQMAVGDVQFEKLARDRCTLWRSDYRFSVAATTTGGPRMELTWRKDMRVYGTTVYECVDEEDRVLGRMASGGMFNFKKGGEVEVVDALDEGVKQLVIVSSLGIWAMEALNYQTLTRGYATEDEKKKQH